MKRELSKELPLRVIGDVHGGFEEFEAIVRHGLEQGRFIVCLGDPEDRGPNPAKVIELIMDLYDEGKADEVMSNHKWKHYRYYDGRPVMLNDEHKKTRRDINSMGREFVERYLEFCKRVPWFIRHGDNFFAHASYHPIACEEAPSRKYRKILQERLIYGQTSGRMEGGLPVRLLDWIDRVPESMNVFVGHHILSTEEILQFQTTGGKVHFVDLGCQSREGGQLAYVDIDEGKITGSSHDISFKDDPSEFGDYRLNVSESNANGE
jgi:uncharacterized protein YbaR (Trm112 family)